MSSFMLGMRAWVACEGDFVRKIVLCCKLGGDFFLGGGRVVGF